MEPLKEINIVHVKTPPKHTRILCHRPYVLGNPFIMKNKSISERNRVCDLYEEFIQNGSLDDEIRKLIKTAKIVPIELACYCAPLRCHTESIKKRIELLQKNYDN